MASRVKRMLHRRKDDEYTSPSHVRAPTNARSVPALRTSLYDVTEPGGLPQTGDYPIKGNDSSVILQQHGRKSSLRSRRSSGSQHNISPTPDRYASQANPVMGAPAPHDIVNPDLQASGQQRRPASGSGQNGQKRWSRGQLPQDFSNLNLGNTGDTTITQTVTTTVVSPGHSNTRNPPHTAEPHAARPATVRPVNEFGLHPPFTATTPKQQSVPNKGNTSHGYQDRKPAYNEDLRVQPSTARKQVGTNSTTASPSAKISLPSHHRRASSGQAYGEKPLPTAPAPLHNAAASRGPNIAPQQSSIPFSSGLSPPDMKAPLDGQTILDRAGSNTEETQVTETFAPGKSLSDARPANNILEADNAPAIVHETVHRDVHHAREELITREIHNHDVFHRMLPVVDVEVLPPRHFLPVEGGGLVEVGAQEVPGRGNNWVIAETASKIPSDQAAPVGARRFTARKFPGHEGDPQRYTTPEGHERTEQTWVHPPELETGARDTGQSWPMVFDDDMPKKGSYGYTSPKPSKMKGSGKSSASHHSPLERDVYLEKGMS
ncbi:MAG: hypothetical protein Q9217_005914 [Psora testacea]